MKKSNLTSDFIIIGVAVMLTISIGWADKPTIVRAGDVVLQQHDMSQYPWLIAGHRTVVNGVTIIRALPPTCPIRCPYQAP